MISFTLRPLYPNDWIPGNHWGRSRMGQRAAVDNLANRKDPGPSQESKSFFSVVKSLSSHYSDWDVPVLSHCCGYCRSL